MKKQMKYPVLAQAIGGKHTIHEISCVFLQDQNIEGYNPVYRVDLSHERLCPCCKEKVVVSQLATDYLQHRKGYLQLIKQIQPNMHLLIRLNNKRAKFTLSEEILEIRIKKMRWHIALREEQIRLIDVTAGEKIQLQNYTKRNAFNEALQTILIASAKQGKKHKTIKYKRDAAEELLVYYGLAS